MNIKEVRQTILDKAYAAMVAQGVPSINADDLCTYLCEDGKRCAIGHLLPPTLTKEDLTLIENCSVLNSTNGTDYMDSDKKKKLIDKRNAIWIELQTFNNLKPNFEEKFFLNYLQGCHDDAARMPGTPFLVEFNKRITALCNRYDLKSPVPALKAH